ncbi:MHYT domain-containing protein [Deinococcus sp.]|uniref:MHYT domain-containing protein n=1 Tax=Deinococcus sp. TaxID=47478 RepID=UPI00286E56ED|nr:MHYT domain-containing protein [Deinococcus sp.]
MNDGMMTYHWNTIYIVLSVVIAISTSFFALELARRLRLNDATWASLSLGGVLGYGIWAMHFIGMIAMQLPTNVAYRLPLTALSGVLAIGFLVAASVFMFRGTATPLRILGSGVIAGTGICLMHYLGMAALEINAVSSYRPVPFAISVLIAVGAATVAFFLFSRVMTTAFSFGMRLAVQIGAALTMGFAIAGMHYTGMAAVQFKPSVTNIGNQVSGTDPQNLVYLIVGVTLVVFVATYIFILADQLSSKSAGAATD